MAMQASGALSFSQVQAEFNDTGDVSLSDFYNPPAGVGGTIPASGTFSFSDFYGASNDFSTSRSTTYTTSFNTSRGTSRWTTKTTSRHTDISQSDSRITYFNTSKTTWATTTFSTSRSTTRTTLYSTSWK